MTVVFTCDDLLLGDLVEVNRTPIIAFFLIILFIIVFLVVLIQLTDPAVPCLIEGISPLTFFILIVEVLSIPSLVKRYILLGVVTV